MIAQSSLQGFWRLISFLECDATGAWVHAMGPSAHGGISYWPGGRMQVLIAGEGRPRLRGEWAQVPAPDKAACLDRMVAYAGEYRVEGERVVHRVTECWIPNWEGRELVRAISFPASGQLQLDTVNAAVTQRVLWQRLDFASAGDGDR